jgi:hypothetical protein
MAERTSKKKGGMAKHGRSKRKKNTALSLFVKGRISAEKYFKAEGLTTHHAYNRKVFSL